MPSFPPPLDPLTLPKCSDHLTLSPSEDSEDSSGPTEFSTDSPKKYQEDFLAVNGMPFSIWKDSTKISLLLLMDYTCPLKKKLTKLDLRELVPLPTKKISSSTTSKLLPNSEKEKPTKRATWENMFPFKKTLDSKTLPETLFTEFLTLPSKDRWITETLPSSGPTLGYSWEMTRTIMETLMTLKLPKETNSKYLLYLLTQINKLPTTILLTGSEERKFSGLTLNNTMDGSDTRPYSKTLRLLEPMSTPANGNWQKDLSTSVLDWLLLLKN